MWLDEAVVVVVRFQFFFSHFNFYFTVFVLLFFFCFFEWINMYMCLFIAIICFCRAGKRGVSVQMTENKSLSKKHLRTARLLSRRIVTAHILWHIRFTSAKLRLLIYTRLKWNESFFFFRFGVCFGQILIGKLRSDHVVAEYDYITWNFKERFSCLFELGRAKRLRRRPGHKKRSHKHIPNIECVSLPSD